MAMKPIPFKGGKVKVRSDGGGERGLPKWLRRLEPAQFRQLLKERPFEAGAIAVAVLCVAFTGRVLVDCFNKVADIDYEIALLKKKKLPVEAQKMIVQEKKEYIKSIVQGVPKKEFISFLTDLAEKRGIVISEFQPITVQTKKYYISSNISFSCSVASFKKVLLFLHDLETSNYSLKVTSLHLKGQDSPTMGLDKIYRQEGVPVTIDVALASLTLLEQ